MKAILATATAAVIAAGCGGDGKPATPEKVAVEWLQAKAAYDGGKEWDLEAPGRRGGADRKEAVEKRKREKAQECPERDDPDCLFPSGVQFTAVRQQKDGRCIRVFVRAIEKGDKTHEEAVAVIRVDEEWRVRDWKALLPGDALSASAARDCGVS
jgi:hypothetical protein